MPDLSKMRCECGGKIVEEAPGKSGAWCEKCGTTGHGVNLALAHGRYWALRDVVDAGTEIEGGVFECQLDHLSRMWPWKDGYLRIYPSTRIDDQIDDGKIDLVPVRVIILKGERDGNN